MHETLSEVLDTTVPSGARTCQERLLFDEGWRSFTAVEVPNFEGFSSGKVRNTQREI